jgi:hypothetical protein
VPEVTPLDLTRRPELIGREVAVDGRLQGTITFHQGKGFDEFHMQRSSVVFRLPPNTYERPPRAKSIWAKGILRKEGDQYSFQVREWKIYQDDLDRLNKAVATLAPDDERGRMAWADWAKQRGAIYDDAQLTARGRELAGEAVRLEAARAGQTEPADLALQRLERALRQGVPPTELAALAHRAFRRLVQSAQTVAELDKLLRRIEADLPNAAAPHEADLSRWSAAYENRPDEAYRQAPEPVRAALDRKLWTDAEQKLLELRLRDDPKKAPVLAQEAETKLPERPEFARDLLQRGIDQASRDVASLRQTDVESFAAIYRDQLEQPDRAKAIVRSWLDWQRAHRLSRDDAEGRVLLAGQYESLLGDQVSSEALLREAWKIDPQSKETADAFRRKGFKLVDGEWQASASAAARGETAEEGPRRRSADPYLGLTRGEIRSKLGKPERVARCATQGQLREQWIYQNLYITFEKRPGTLHPVVVAHATLK